MEADIGDEEEELSVTAKTKFIPYSRKLDRKKKSYKSYKRGICANGEAY